MISISGRSYRMKERQAEQMGEVALPEEAPKTPGTQSTGVGVN